MNSEERNRKFTNIDFEFISTKEHYNYLRVFTFSYLGTILRLTLCFVPGEPVLAAKHQPVFEIINQKRAFN